LQIDSCDGKTKMTSEQAPGIARKKRWDMELTFVAKDPGSVPDGSPALYRTDRKSWIVQGWAVTDPAALTALNLPEGETCVEIPDRLIPYFQTRT
jgi:hypothetical protein